MLFASRQLHCLQKATSSGVFRSYMKKYKPEDPSIPEYDPLDFEPFKLQVEKEKIAMGYTMEEVFGKYYGINHPPAIKREMTKDSIVFTVVGIVLIVMAFQSANITRSEEKDFKEYLLHDMHTIRPLPDRIQHPNKI